MAENGPRSVGRNQDITGSVESLHNRSVAHVRRSQAPSAEEEVYFFGPFRLKILERLLERGDRPVALGSRALDILVALVERSGEVVSQRDLMARAWPNLVVEEANLRVHMSGLRKALGEGQHDVRYITNVPGRGYCFVAQVRRDESARGEAAGAAEASPVLAPTNLPPLLGRIFGRDPAISELLDLLSSHRLVNVVGPGGIGKTTVAVAVAHALLDEFDQRVYFVDLGTITEAPLVPAATAAALGVYSARHDPFAALAAALVAQRVLLVLDNCEHVIDVVAKLVEHLLCDAPKVHVIATSRESLRVAGEHVYLVQALGCPPAGGSVTVSEALSAPSVQLFMDRAVASGHRVALAESDAQTVAQICRRLDGSPLAIELAASRVGTYGIQGTIDLLDDHFRLLWAGRRSGLPRHQTLHSLLEWSYGLLTEREKKVFRRLSIFVGAFTPEAAAAVAADAGTGKLDALASLRSLMEKSLVSTLNLGSPVCRLLESTRAYAAEKLREAEGKSEVAERHAQYCYGLFAADVSAVPLHRGHDLSRWAPQIGNIQAALEWAFAGEAGKEIGIDLAARSAHVFVGLSLLSECQRWCEVALRALQGSERGTQRELALQEASAISAMFARGNSDQVRAAFSRGLELAEALGDLPQQLRALDSLHFFLIRRGEFSGALAVAFRSVTLAQELALPDALALTDWMLGCAHHALGDQRRAQDHCEASLKRSAASGPTYGVFFGVYHRIRTLIVLSRVLWLRGHADRARRTARQAIDAAERRRHPLDRSSTIYAATVFIWCGDFDLASERIERLLAVAAENALGPYQAVATALKGELAIARGEYELGVDLLRSALSDLHFEQQHFMTVSFFRALAEGHLRSGNIEEAGAVLQAAVVRTEQWGATFDWPEVLRVQAAIRVALPKPDVLGAEASLIRALSSARDQAALSLELRAAIDLARLWKSAGRGAEAQELLQGVYGQFTEGFDTPSLEEARQLLQAL